jgi:hypothetical protein
MKLPEVHVGCCSLGASQFGRSAAFFGADEGGLMIQKYHGGTSE